MLIISGVVTGSFQNTDFYLDSLLEFVQEPIIVTSSIGIILSLNQLTQKLFQIRKGENIFEYLPGLLTELPNEKLPQENEKIIRYSGQTWLIKIKLLFENTDNSAYILLFNKLYNKKAREDNHTIRYSFSQILTRNKTLENIISLGKKAAFCMRNILITGETGTGKELLAQSIHLYGPRKSGPFLAVNCGAIPSELIGSELFGYEGGAFTGALSKGKKGKFLLADKGTIFLDEIGDLPLSVQVYLLRVLEEREIQKVGGGAPIPIDVRVIAATHKNLLEEVKKGTFREDLFYRLNIIHFHLPPLRERIEDIPLLSKHYIQKLGFIEPQIEMDADVLDCLKKYQWPGNIRELRNVIDRALFYAEEKICMEHLPTEITLFKEVDHVNSDEVLPNPIRSKKHRLKELDKEMLCKVLEETDGNLSKAAKLLEVSRMTLYRKMKLL